MDDRRFDDLTKTLSGLPSRRNIIRVLVAGMLGGAARGAVPDLGADTARAKKRRRGDRGADRDPNQTSPGPREKSTTRSGVVAEKKKKGNKNKKRPKEPGPLACPTICDVVVSKGCDIRVPITAGTINGIIKELIKKLKGKYGAKLGAKIAARFIPYVGPVYGIICALVLSGNTDCGAICDELEEDWEDLKCAHKCGYCQRCGAGCESDCRVNWFGERTPPFNCCRGDNGVCDRITGACVADCPDGRTECLSNNQHVCCAECEVCGDGGLSCVPGCNAGCPCPAGQSCCNGGCFDTQRDEDHCGDECRKCPDDEFCCGGQCVDFQTDPNHCGNCGDPGDPDDEHVCKEDEECCKGECIPTSWYFFHGLHCGGCDRPVGEGQICCSRIPTDASLHCCNPTGLAYVTCQAECCGFGCCQDGWECCGGATCCETATQECCGERCCDLATEACCGDGCCDLETEECCGGGCHRRDSGGRCCDGEWVSADLTCGDGCPCGGITPDCCDGACTSTRTDPRHCGACNNPCPEGERCCTTGGVSRCIGADERCGDPCPECEDCVWVGTIRTYEQLRGGHTDIDRFGTWRLLDNGRTHLVLDQDVVPNYECGIVEHCHADTTYPDLLPIFCNDGAVDGTVDEDDAPAYCTNEWCGGSNRYEWSIGTWDDIRIGPDLVGTSVKTFEGFNEGETWTVTASWRLERRPRQAG